MKILANFLVTISLLFGQLNLPPAAQAGDPTPTGTETSLVTNTPEPSATPTVEQATDTPEPSETPTALETETATATESATGTIPVTESLEPTGTALPSETATPVPPSETPTPEGPAPITLSLSSTPEFITRGGMVTIHWAIDGISPLPPSLTLKIVLSEGCQPQGPEKDLFDPATRTLTIPVAEPQGHFQAFATNLPGDPSTGSGQA